MTGVFRRRSTCSRQKDHAEGRHDPRRESNGTPVLGAELDLADDHNGIIELPDDAPLGASFAKV